jgi:proteic killer suppression protein
VIESFRCRDTEKLFNKQRVRRFQAIEQPARRKLEMLYAATSLNDLAIVPGNRLEALQGDRAGEYSIRINQQWRICFIWKSRMRALSRLWITIRREEVLCHES